MVLIGLVVLEVFGCLLLICLEILKSKKWSSSMALAGLFCFKFADVCFSFDKKYVNLKMWSLMWHTIWRFAFGMLSNVKNRPSDFLNHEELERSFASWIFSLSAGVLDMPYFHQFIMLCVVLVLQILMKGKVQLDNFSINNWCPVGKWIFLMSSCLLLLLHRSKYLLPREREAVIFQLTPRKISLNSKFRYLCSWSKKVQFWLSWLLGFFLEMFPLLLWSPDCAVSWLVMRFLF